MFVELGGRTDKATVMGYEQLKYYARQIFFDISLKNLPNNDAILLFIAILFIDKPLLFLNKLQLTTVTQK